mgnify:CR=1 FL=1
MQVLITGSAGFIGFHLCMALIKTGHDVIGIDNFNNYYDVNLKKARNEQLLEISKNHLGSFKIFDVDITDNISLEEIFHNNKIKQVINLAAQAGVRYSIENPSKYIQANIVGFGNILENCKLYKIEHLIYASSSSVYGGNQKIPFSEFDNVDHPVSLYAASKKANELMAHTYSHLFKLPTTGLRFFTVYGPWGRPDMALFLFTKNIIEGKAIEVFNHGNMLRDFTYIDDIVSSIEKLIYKIPKENKEFDFIHPKPSESWAPYKIFNIGNSQPTQLMNYIAEIEKCLNKRAKINFLPMQKGDVKATYADTSSLEAWIDYKPSTSIEIGIKQFLDWYRIYYNISM